MNLDKIGPPEGPQYPAPPEWKMQLHREGLQYIAVVERSEKWMCRLSLASSLGDEEATRTALANKARAWIHDYLAREAAEGKG